MRSASRNTVKSVARALALLNTLRVASDGLSLSDLCAQTNLAKGTIHRLLATLLKHDFVEQQGHRYYIGVNCFVVGNAFRSHMDLRPRALPFLLDLRNRTGEAVQMAVLEKSLVVYIERVQSTAPVASFTAQVGSVVPAYCTALGKVLLAFSPQEILEQYLRAVPLRIRTPTTITERQQFVSEITNIRRAGYAVDRGEHYSEVRCVAAPIFDHDSRVVAAISMAGPAERLPSVLEGSRFARAVVDVAAKISAAIGHVRVGGAARGLSRADRQRPLLNGPALRALSSTRGMKRGPGLVRRSVQKA